MKKSELLIVLLAHNEAGCIADTVQELIQMLPSVQVAVVDDGSRDDTAARAESAGAIVLKHPFNLGVAAGEATGLQYARRHGYPFVVRMDGDGQHDPASVASMVESLQSGAELVVGSRFAGEESFRSTAMRRIGNRFLARLVTWLSGQPVTDPTSGFRAFGGRAIDYFSDTHPHDYPEPESLLMASQQGFRIREVPVRMRPRRTGTSSLTPLRAGFYMAKVSFALLMERMRA